MNLKNQRRMAASILKCGEERIWIDPNRIEDVADAITRSDIRLAISSGTIRKMPAKGQSKARAAKLRIQRSKGRRKGHGSRKGTAGARSPKKRRWIRTLRPLRRLLKEMRDQGKIDRTTYRRFYLMAKGGMFKSKAHLEQHLRGRGTEGGGT